MVILTAVAAKSKVNMAEGAEVSCLVDAWIKEMIDARLGQGDQTEEDRKVLVREFSDHEIAMVVLSFLFASQDAMSSAFVSTIFDLILLFSSSSSLVVDSGAEGWQGGSRRVEPQLMFSPFSSFRFGLRKFSLCQVNVFELLADHPDILAKVREEQLRVRDNDVDAPLSLELVDSMTYTRAMIKEALRLLPPVIMVSLILLLPSLLN